MRYVKCLFCDNRRLRGSSFCSFCQELYYPYKLEQWFQELIQMEQRQRTITKIESSNYDVDFFSKGSDAVWGSSRKRGRPKTADIVESFIRSVYKEELSIRQVTRLCVSAGLLVSRESVRSIINKIKLTKK
jgi:hypothetical protein